MHLFRLLSLLFFQILVQHHRIDIYYHLIDNTDSDFRFTISKYQKNIVSKKK